MLNEPAYVTTFGGVIAAAAAALVCSAPRPGRASELAAWDGVRVIAFVSGFLASLILLSSTLEAAVLRDMLQRWSEASSGFSGVSRPTLAEVGRLVAASRPLTAAIAVAGWSSVTIAPAVTHALMACGSSFA